MQSFFSRLPIVWIKLCQRPVKKTCTVHGPHLTACSGISTRVVTVPANNKLLTKLWL